MVDRTGQGCKFNNKFIINENGAGCSRWKDDYAKTICEVYRIKDMHRIGLQFV